MKKNKSTFSHIFSEEERIALLEGFQKQNTYTTAVSYEKANNANKGSLHRWSRRYGIPLGFHHRNPRKRFPEEQKLALLEGFHKQNTYTTVAKYAKVNNVSKSTLRDWSVLCGIPLGGHPGKVLQAEERIALLEGFQKQNTYTTIESYEKANNLIKGSLSRWSALYGIPLGFHHRNPRKRFPKEQKLALLEGFQKQNTYTTIESYTKANNVNRRLFQFWSALYGIPLGNHHTKVLRPLRQATF